MPASPRRTIRNLALLRLSPPAIPLPDVPRHIPPFHSCQAGPRKTQPCLSGPSRPRLPNHFQQHTTVPDYSCLAKPPEPPRLNHTSPGRSCLAEQVLTKHHSTVHAKPRLACQALPYCARPGSPRHSCQAAPLTPNHTSPSRAFLGDSFKPTPTKSTRFFWPSFANANAPTCLIDQGQHLFLAYQSRIKFDSDS